MKEVDTTFGLAVSCTLEDCIMGGGVINVFLPKSIKITTGEVLDFNERKVPPVALIFRGKNKTKFVIDFE